jgi:hypothetical protein
MAAFFCKYLFCFDTVVVVFFPQAFHLYCNYVKIHHMIQAHLGKLIKRIKIVTMGLIICAKESDVPAGTLMLSTTEHEARNTNLEKT